MLYDLAEGVKSLDAMHGDAYAKAATEMYEKDNNGPLGSPGMLMGFVSYASLVGKEKLDETIKEIRQNSRAQTEFEKKQEDVIVDQLSGETFANIQTFCIPCQLDMSAGESQVQFFSAPPGTCLHMKVAKPPTVEDPGLRLFKRLTDGAQKGKIA